MLETILLFRKYNKKYRKNKNKLVMLVFDDFSIGLFVNDGNVINNFTIEKCVAKFYSENSLHYFFVNNEVLDKYEWVNKSLLEK